MVGMRTRSWDGVNRLRKVQRVAAHADEPLYSTNSAIGQVAPSAAAVVRADAPG